MSEKTKITDFDAAKRRVGAQKKDKSPTANGGYEAALRKQKGRSVGAGLTGQIRWFHYLQLFLLLGLVAWLMKSCNY